MNSRSDDSSSARDINDEPCTKKAHLENYTTAPSETSLNTGGGSLSTTNSTDTKEGILTSGDGGSNVGASQGATNGPNPLKWSVQDVCDFIKCLPGCGEYVEDFAMQEIDGQALMLLQAKHLMQAMSMKLGPALKIVAKIDAMREALEANVGTSLPATAAMANP